MIGLAVAISIGIGVFLAIYIDLPVGGVGVCRPTSTSEITDKYIIEVFGFDERRWYNASKPFVTDINKAMIFPHRISANKNVNGIKDFYGYKTKLIPLKITTL